MISEVTLVMVIINNNGTTLKDISKMSKYQPLVSGLETSKSSVFESISRSLKQVKSIS